MYHTQQLVSSVFRELWFTMPPTGAAQRESLERRVGQITAVVSCSLPHTCTWLLYSLSLMSCEGCILQGV